MQIEVSGSRCAAYTYCSRLHRTTKHGNRCRHYQERGNVEKMYRFKAAEENSSSAEGGAR